MSAQQPTLADLVDSLGAELASMEGSPIIQANGRTIDTRTVSFRGLMISSRIYEPTGVEIEAARNHLATMPAERREQLMKEWDQ